MKTCSKCSENKDESDFFVKDKKSGRLHAHCKECYKEHRKTFYAAHYAKYGNLYRERARLRREAVKKEFRTNMLALLKKSACEVCGESDIRVLEFDHLDPTTKTFSISQAVKYGYSWSEVLNEIKKCRILCANCHKKHTAAQSKWYKNI
ncbi:TPA: hypothetical protein DHU97_03640 [Candidatus Saccharibacteria bacterium]|nr:hypothetical protein [Candidatus Saccharibacteria bacterium]